jgi:predicted DNA-binding transcriptional regulator AlpA
MPAAAALRTKKTDSNDTDATTVKLLRSGNVPLGTHERKPLPDDAVMMTATQVRNFFGGRSAMWLWRKLNPMHSQHDPNFPKPVRFPGGRMTFWRVDEVRAYAASLTVTGGAR